MSKWYEDFVDRVCEKQPKIAPRRSNLIIFPKPILVDDKAYMPMSEGEALYEEIFGGEG